MATRDRDEYCPHCGRASERHTRLTLYIYPEQWAFSLLFGVIVAAYGRMIGVTGDILYTTTLLAMIPPLIAFRARLFCEICEEEISPLVDDPL